MRRIIPAVVFVFTASIQMPVLAGPPGWTGPTSVSLGSTHTYTYDNGTSPAGLMWYVWKGLIVSSSQSGTLYTITVQWVETGAGNLYLGYEGDIVPYGFTVRDVTISGSMPATPNTTYTVLSTSCNRTVIKRNTNPSAGYTWYWQSSSTGSSNFLGSADTVVLTTPGTTTLYLRSNMNGTPIWSAAQSAGTRTVITPPSAPATATDGHGIGNTATPVPLSVGAVSGATSYRWYENSAGGTAISGATTTSYTASVTQTKTYYAEAWVEGCGSSTRKAVVANLHPEPVITSNDGSINMGSSAVLKVDNYAYDSYQWLVAETGAPISGATSATFSTGATGNFLVRVTKNSASADTSSAFVVGEGMEGLNMNYVIANTILIPGVTSEEAVPALMVEERSQTIQYFDGLGAPMQTVITQGSPLKKDIVQQAVYDNFGREHRKYLPVVVDRNSGWYKPGILNARGAYSSIAEDFYQDNPTARIAQDTMPYTQTVFEASPSGRPLKDFGAGSEWTVNNKSIRYAYRINTHATTASDTAEKVIAWKISNNRPERMSAHAGYIAANGYYAASQLTVRIVKDEQNNAVREYTNKQGQVILKKVQAVAADSTNLNSAAGWALTYYVYDPVGNLRFVLPPELSKIAHSSDTAVMNSARLASWAFQYTYDARGRMATKQVPGAGTVYMVYDNRDRVVLTQDANQRANQQWIFTKYDVLNRPVMTGLYIHSDSISCEAMAALISTTQFAEQYDNTKPHGYTTALFPSASLTLHSVTYYDSYAFRDDLAGSRYNFVNNHLTGQDTAYFTRVTGQVTGTKVNILGTNDYLWNVNYYDDDYRIIQAVAQNQKDSLDRVTNVYDFVGNVLKTKTTHSTVTASTDITRSFAYDHAGRLLKTYHKINSEDSVLLVQNQYNELGQLVTKHLHSRNETGFAQTVDYRYNIRGWLTSINDPVINPTALFNFNLKYNDPTLSGVDAQYNGNISQANWKTAGSDASSYGYAYDAMNRLTEAAYVNHVNPLASGRFNESIMNGSGSGYDLNGNILFLQRTGKTGTTAFGNMDDLTYTYTGNQVTRIDDAVATAAGQDGFKELVKTSNEYTYDANGNMTADANKGVTLISYNHLNLPAVVRKSGADSIVYAYDATGRKLKQQVYGAKPKLTDYAGEFIYENDTLRFINHEEGRVLPDTSSTAAHPWEYQYHLKDHLGNVRVTFSEKTTTTEYLATMEKDPSSIETEENSQFLNMNTSKKLAFYNHTEGVNKQYSYRLSGSSTEVVGPAKSMEVNPGDVVDLEVYARYANLTSTNSSVSTLLSSLISAFSLSSSGGSGLTGEDAYNSFGTIFSGGPFIGPGDYEDEDAPKAYLNYILFDEEFIPVDFGFDQVSENAATAHEYLSLHVKVQQKGYLYIYLSNENNKLVDVFFDDLKVIHYTGVEQSDDYYAFGLNFNSYQRENSVKNNYNYNGKELQDELGLEWLDYGARMYDRTLGRWMVNDPKADKYAQYSPYNYVLNCPLIFTDPDGKEIYFVTSDGAVIAATKENLQNTAMAAAYNGMVATETGQQTWNQYASNDKKDIYITMSDKIDGSIGGITINQGLSADMAQSKSVTDIAGFEGFKDADLSKSKDKEVALISLNASKFSKDATDVDQVEQAETLNHEMVAHVQIKDEQRKEGKDSKQAANHNAYGSTFSVFNSSGVAADSPVGKFLTQIISSDKIKLSKEAKNYIQSFIKKKDDDK